MINSTEEKEINLTPHYVAYVDILGIKDCINSDKSEEYLNRINNVYQEFISMIYQNKKHLYYLNRSKVKIFSDNIILAMPTKELFQETIDDLNSYYMMLFVSCLQMIAFNYGFLLRGSIVSDDLYIDDNFVYGKALTKAYELENSLAIYPRIIINPKDISLFINSSLQKEMLQKDKSNIYYINPFICYGQLKKDDTWKEIAKEKLEARLKVDSSDKINQKVCWFINMFNDYCDKEKEYKKFKIDLNNYPYTEEKEVVCIKTGTRRFE